MRAGAAGGDTRCIDSRGIEFVLECQRVECDRHGRTCMHAFTTYVERVEGTQPTTKQGRARAARPNENGWRDMVATRSANKCHICM